ncbi:hypothetical protein BDK51DRAFT_31362 [Blyttiomyces helicus]|uniref:Uncharacterized protein n=1 Tax=Blyttiomyces helicus TaxID=388810 RepID=A0A4P9WKE3_9FUNG|nr:hypothetical protein BDK51DRAFT_31362 [Blyttiomyces helicus]|eukprot:RKO91076.1 hypothetical protein BDK51DRAFT_31362 [Blyttiomyces helicus]
MLLGDVCNVLLLYLPQLLLQRSRSVYPKAISCWEMKNYWAPPSAAWDMREAGQHTFQAVAGHAGTCDDPDSGAWHVINHQGEHGRLLFPRLGSNKIMDSRGLEARARSLQAVDLIFGMRDGDDPVRAQWVANSGGPPYNINLERAFSDRPCQQSERGECECNREVLEDGWLSKHMGKLVRGEHRDRRGPISMHPFHQRPTNSQCPTDNQAHLFSREMPHPRKNSGCDTRGCSVVGDNGNGGTGRGEGGVRGGGKPEPERKWGEVAKNPLKKVAKVISLLFQNLQVVVLLIWDEMLVTKKDSRCIEFRGPFSWETAVWDPAANSFESGTLVLCHKSTHYPILSNSPGVIEAQKRIGPMGEPGGNAQPAAHAHTLLRVSEVEGQGDSPGVHLSTSAAALQKAVCDHITFNATSPKRTPERQQDFNLGVPFWVSRQSTGKQGVGVSGIHIVDLQVAAPDDAGRLKDKGYGPDTASF